MTPLRHSHPLASLAAMAVAAMAALATLAACSSQQLYEAGQGWQRQECEKILDAQERGRCIAATRNSYDSYKRQTEAKP
ncbi:MAG: hypothetical protein WA086_06595 [Ideonella sp.]